MQNFFKTIFNGRYWYLLCIIGQKQFIEVYCQDTAVSFCFVDIIMPAGVNWLNDWYSLSGISLTPMVDIDSLVQDCSNTTANALELLQSCTEPSIYCV